MFNLCMDHAISTGRQMMNVVSNFECLFSFFFQPTLKSDLKEAQFTQNYLFWVKAPLWYLEGAPSFKTRPWLKNITITNIQNSTINSSFDALSKWHDSDLDDCAIFVVIRTKRVINISPFVQFFFVRFRFDQKKCYFEEY